MLRCLLTLALAVTLAACASDATVTGTSDGRTAAERDIAAGTPSLLFLGLPRHDRSILDEETGLPTYSRGCVISDESAGYVGAYNDTMREALADGRLEGMTFKHKWLTRKQLNGHLEAGGHDLVLDGPAVKNPSGEFAVFLKHHLGDTTYIWIEDEESGRAEAITFLGEPKGRIHFAHDGTTLIVRDDQYQRTFTIDLPHRQELQSFPDDERDW